MCNENNKPSSFAIFFLSSAESFQEKLCQKNTNKKNERNDSLNNGRRASATKKERCSINLNIIVGKMLSLSLDQKKCQRKKTRTEMKALSHITLAFLSPATFEQALIRNVYSFYHFHSKNLYYVSCHNTSVVCRLLFFPPVAFHL